MSNAQMPHPLHNQALPLPGKYECLTLQANITLYRAGGTARGVVILRDPNANNELERRTFPLQLGTPLQLETFLRDMTAELNAALWLLHGTETLMRLSLSEEQRVEAAPAPPKRKRTSTTRS